MARKILLLVCLLTLCGILNAQSTYTYKYKYNISNLDNGETTSKDTTYDITVSVSSNKKTAYVVTAPNIVYKYRGKHGGYHTYAIYIDTSSFVNIGYLAKTYMYTAWYMMFSEDYEELIHFGARKVGIGDQSERTSINDVYYRCHLKELQKKYDHVNFLEKKEIYIVKKGKYYGVCDIKGKEVVAPKKYTLLEPSGTGYRVTAGKYVGVLNSSFSEVIATNRYTEIAAQSNGYIVKAGDKVGYVTLTGTEIIAPNKYTSVDIDGSNGFYVKQNNKVGYCNSSGNVVIPVGKYESITSSGGMFIVKRGGKAGICNNTGTEVIAPDKYTTVKVDAGKGYIVSANNSDGYCDLTGREIITPRYSSVEKDSYGGFVVSNYQGSYGYCTSDGKEIVYPAYDKIKRVAGLGFQCTKGNYMGWVNMYGEVIVPAERYTDIQRHTDGSFSVKKGQFYGYLNSDGDVVIEANKYTDITRDGDKGFKVKVNNKEGYCNSTGEEILSPSFRWYVEATYSYGLTYGNSYIGVRVDYTPKRLGGNVSLSSDLGFHSLSMIAGPTYKLSGSDKGLQAFVGIGFSTGLNGDGVSLAGEAGIRYAFDCGDLKKFESFSLSLAMRYLDGQYVPTVGINCIPAALTLKEMAKDDEFSFPHHYSEMMAAYGSSGFMLGLNYAYVPTHLGGYASFMYGDGMALNFGPVFRLTDGISHGVDVQLYQGIGTFYGSLGGETGIRLGFSKDMGYGYLSLSLGVMYSASDYAVSLGLSWPISYEVCKVLWNTLMYLYPGYRY